VGVFKSIFSDAVHCVPGTWPYIRYGWLRISCGTSTVAAHLIPPSVSFAVGFFSVRRNRPGFLPSKAIDDGMYIVPSGTAVVTSGTLIGKRGGATDWQPHSSMAMAMMKLKRTVCLE